MATIPELVTEAVAAAACEVVEIKQPRRMSVQVMIDREPDGVGVDDLTRLTRSLHEAFEREGLDPGEYEIEVLSPGLDRPLVRDKDFVRFAGSNVHLRLKEKRSLDGRRNFKGKLIGLDEGRIVIEDADDKDEPWRFPRDEVKDVKLIPDLPKVPKHPSSDRKRKPRKSRRKRPKDH